MSYTKSLSSDFSGNLKSGQFHEELSLGITGANVTGIKIKGDVVTIDFSSSLSSGDQTILNTLISNHVPDNSVPKKNFYTFSPRDESTKSTSYKTMKPSFKYDGSGKIGTINYIEVISYKDKEPDSYSIRIYDKTNNKVIAEKTGLTNTEESVVDLGSISNIPTDQAIFEIHAKRVGGKKKKIYVENVIIYFDN